MREKTMTVVFMAMLILIALLSQVTVAKTISLWTAETGAARWYAEVFKPAFESEYPGVTLNVSIINWNEFYDQFIVRGVSSTLPDIVTSNNAMFVVSGLVTDLRPFVESWDKASDLYLPALNMLTYKGTLYGLPLTVRPVTYIYNKLLLSEGGYDAQAPPLTWDEVISAAKRLNRRSSSGDIVEQLGASMWLSPQISVWPHQGLVESMGGASSILMMALQHLTNRKSLGVLSCGLSSSGTYTLLDRVAPQPV